MEGIQLINYNFMKCKQMNDIKILNCQKENLQGTLY